MRTVLFALVFVAVTSCEKSKPASTARQQAKEDKAAGKAEVEFFGHWSAGEVKAAKYVFVAQAEPCLPVPEKPTRYGESALEKPGALFAEIYVPQGSKGSACVYGLDEAGKVVSAAGSTQNPLTFQGQGEVIFGRLEFDLKAP